MRSKDQACHEVKKKVKHVMRLKGKAGHEDKDQAFHEVKKVKHVMRSKGKACYEVKDQACAGTQNTILLSSMERIS